MTTKKGGNQIRFRVVITILTRLAHVEESGAEQELPRLAVPVAPGAQEPHVLLDLEMLASAQKKFLEKSSKFSASFANGIMQAVVVQFVWRLAPGNKIK
jgi:hypothetical protein